MSWLVALTGVAPPAGGTSGGLGAGDCERLRGGRVAQPVNTATCTGYLAAGAAVARRATGSRDRSGPAVAYGGLLALVGLGSLAYHGPQPRGSELGHDLPIALLLALIPVTAGVRMLRGDEVAPGLTRARSLTAAGLWATAGAAYAAGRTGAPTCKPDSRLQWHGVWHVLSASAFAVVGDILYRPVAGGR